MTAEQLLTYLSWALYLGAFVSVVRRLARLPTRAHVEMALFFGAIALVIGLSTFLALLDLPTTGWPAIVESVAVMALPYLLLRLGAEFATVPRWLLRSAEVGLAAAVVALLAFPQPLPTWLTLLLVAYFVLLAGYDTVLFVRQAGRTRGVTHRRMQAVALGSGLLALDILFAGLGAAIPAWEPEWTLLSLVSGLASGAAYLVGFAPPTWLRRAWQEPELRAFLGRAASLPRLPDTAAIRRELEAGAAGALGATRAAVDLWEEESGTLRFSWAEGDGPESQVAPGAHVAGRAFAEQRPVLLTDMVSADPARRTLYERTNARAVLAAPITAGSRRLGVLVIFAPHEPIFARSDLELVQLLADQAAVILESRALIDEAARVRAREETARMKEDFLSSAAHDLKTPLASIVGTTQLLLRRARRDPQAPPDTTGLERVESEARRLQEFIGELLDASRLERGGLIERERLVPVDLGELAREVCGADRSGRERCQVDAAGPVAAPCDPVRARQLLENLVENALKYSPESSPVTVRVWADDGQARLAVEDHGIGIAAEDLPRVFDRFHRGRNVDDRRFAGLGLGLYICRGIAEQHGGRIWAESVPGEGSTFNVALPLAVAEPVAPMQRSA